MPRYITTSNLFPDELRAIIASDQPLAVSGQPLNHTQTDKEWFFDDCAMVIEEPFFVTTALIRNQPAVGHRHLRDIYHGQYPIISGQSLETGDEYTFGVLEVLRFQLEIISPDLP